MERDRSGRWCWRIDALRLIIKQYQDWRFWLYHRAMAALPIQVDRARKIPLAAQINSRCHPSRWFGEEGFSGALGLATRGLPLGRLGAWLEHPCLPLRRP